MRGSRSTRNGNGNTAYYVAFDTFETNAAVSTTSGGKGMAAPNMDNHLSTESGGGWISRPEMEISKRDSDAFSLVSRYSPTRNESDMDLEDTPYAMI